MQAKVKKVMRGYKSKAPNSNKGEKVSSQFVKEMEKAYPKGATVTPMKKGY